MPPRLEMLRGLEQPRGEILTGESLTAWPAPESATTTICSTRASPTAGRSSTSRMDADGQRDCELRRLLGWTRRRDCGVTLARPTSS